MNRHAFIIAVFLLAGCGTQVEPDTVVLTPGKSDDTTATELVDFDESDPRWALVTECVGFDLCLDAIVAGRDRADLDSDAFAYPMQRVIDELFFASDLRISPNCEGKLGFDAEQNVGCAPEDSDAFLFGLAVSVEEGADSTWQWVEYDYEGPARARLFQDTETDTYYLDVR